MKKLTFNLIKNKMLFSSLDSELSVVKMTVSLFVCLFVCSSNASAQFTNSSDNWETMADVKYEKSQDEYGEIYVPKFGDDVQKMNGKTISLKGFIIPFEGMFEPKHIIISSLPIAACFFCGGSGPETVAEAYLKEEIKYTAKPVTVTGRLELNDTDYDQLMYILKDAEVKID
ncbi:hypothetical protein SAMN05421640_2599 [Ekhidna lutea]|uniref:DUF3299 domain-containing protein n=1 Tax=Ekhidna lutea TaxID=447679 RepID=A0A239KE81_EKHLU|nr:hypothetical protein [Ekhidna lutea]SNT16451.1 hypothetical protein SAMN05421640_2599 [Ekhidna lutea]